LGKDGPLRTAGPTVLLPSTLNFQLFTVYFVLFTFHALYSIINNKMIGVMADSHDNLPAIKQAVSFFRRANCSLVIHAGDLVAPFSARELAALNCPVKAVFGNCDGEKIGLKKALHPFGEITKAPFRFSAYNHNFLVTHLHSKLETYIASGTYEIIIFGHTHRPEIKKKNNTLLLNPGETGGWLSGQSTVALLDPSTLTAEIIYL